VAESNIKLRVDAGGAVAALNQTNAASRRVSQSVAGLGIALRALPFIGMAEAARRFFGGFAEADKATAAVRTLGVDADKLKRKLLGVSNELKGLVGQTELTAAAYDVASAGFTDAADAAEVLRAATLGAVGGLSNLKTVADATTSVLNAYGLGADKAAGLVDKFIQTQNDGKIVVAQYARQIGRVAPIAAAAGVGIDELNAAISAITATGVPVESTFAGLRQAIASVIKPTKEAKDTAKLLGIEFSTAAIKTKGFGGFLEEVIEKTGGSEVALTKLFSSVEAVGAIIPLANDKLVKFNSSLDNQRDSAGAAERATEELGGTVSTQVTSIVNNIGNVARQLDGVLGPALKRTLDGINQIINAASIALAKLTDLTTGELERASSYFQGFGSVLLKSEGGLQKVKSAVEALNPAVAGSTAELDKMQGALNRARRAARTVGSNESQGFKDLAVKTQGAILEIERLIQVRRKALGSLPTQNVVNSTDNSQVLALRERIRQLLGQENQSGNVANNGVSNGASNGVRNALAKLQSLRDQVALARTRTDQEARMVELQQKIRDIEVNRSVIGDELTDKQIQEQRNLFTTLEIKKHLETQDKKALKDQEALAKAQADAAAAQAKAAEKLDKVYESIGDSISTSIVDSLTAAVEGTKSLAEVATNTLRDIGNMLLKFGINSLLSGLGGGDGIGFFSKLFPRANGGSVMNSGSYLVGEKGPELFTPGRSGSIAPNGSLGGGTNVTVNVDASGSSVEGDEDQASQLGKMLGAAVQAELIKQKRPGGLLTS